MYDVAWAQATVESWAKLSTRVQLLQQVYDSFLDSYLPKEPNPIHRNLLQDLRMVLAASSTNPDAAWAWREVKKIERKKEIPIKAYTGPNSATLWQTIYLYGKGIRRKYHQPELW